MDTAAQMAQRVGGTLSPEGWDCPDCGQRGVTSNFCPTAAKSAPPWTRAGTAPTADKGVTSNFCPNCGKKRPAIDAGWDCPDCGQKGIQSKFCPNCGKKREG